MKKAEIVEGLHITYSKEDGFWLNFEIDGVTCGENIGNDKPHSIIASAKWNWCVDWMNKHGKKIIANGITLIEMQALNKKRSDWLEVNKTFIQEIDQKLYKDLENQFANDRERYGLPGEQLADEEANNGE